MTNEPAAIDLNRLSVSYGSKAILHDLTVQMTSGGIGLLGPNGAGKSTLLKTIMGFIRPDQGQALVFGVDAAQNGAEVRQMLGYMPEEEAYIPGMTAVEFVSYHGRLSGLPSNEAVLRAHQCLHYCGLGEARYRKIDTYSTGMKQRIKLAQALIHDPKLLLLDEPTNGLDPEGRKSMLDLIADITQNKDISVILSSHLLPDVEAVCESVLVLFQGRVVSSGKIDQLKQLAQRAFEVTIKGDENRFREAIQRFGGNCAEKESGLLRVTLREGLGQREIFIAARDSDVQVRRMTQEEMTLQEVFAKAIQAA